jgi:hypothetical protein
MSLRTLQRRLGQLAAAQGLRRCACGAILPAALTQARRIDIRESYALPESLEAPVRHATPAEAQELQVLLNRALEQHPALAQRRGTGHQIYGGEPSESALLRFHFAAAGDGGPCCPRCGRPVVVDPGVRFIEIMAPPPEELLDLLRLDAMAAVRFAELTAAWQQRATLQAGSWRLRDPMAGTSAGPSWEDKR